MKKQGLASQMAILAGAIVLGVLLDRLVQAAVNPPATTEHRDVAAGSSNQNNSAGAVSTPIESASATEPAPHNSPAAAAARKASLDAILAERDPRQRLRELNAFISALGPADYPDALKRIRQINSSNERELASRLLLTQWAQTDPEGALQFAAGNRSFEYVAEDVFEQLAATDFNAAIARAKGIPGNELRYRALRGALTSKADVDPRGALELAKSFGEFHGFESLSSAIYRQWAAVDPQAAALSAAETATPDERWRSPVNAVVDTWAGQDPAAAAKWSLSLPTAEAQARSISQVMREWSRQDPTAAANWIHSLESGAAHDAAVAGFAQALVMSDPQTAINWVGSIADDATRTRTLQRISGPVMWRDPQNGPAMLQAAGLPADQIRGGRRGRGR